MITKRHVFLSYCRRDDEIMQYIKTTLLSELKRLWCDEGIHNTAPSWQNSLAEAIEQAYCMVVLLSPESLKSEWVQKEIHYARYHKIPIIPVLICGEEGESVPFCLAGAQYIDMRFNIDLGMARLLSTIWPLLPADFPEISLLDQVENDELTPVFNQVSLESEAHQAAATPPLIVCAEELYTAQDNYRWQVTTRQYNGIDLVLVPAGQMYMGQDDLPHAQSVHLQTFNRPVWVGMYPVINAQYAEAVNAGICPQPLYWHDPDFNDPLQPVVGINWFDALRFAMWKGMRLPNEAEWEYIARGPEGWRWPWGNRFDDYEVVYQGNAEYGPYPAMGRFKAASWVGARDMAGNVAEWTTSIFDNVNYPYPYWSGDGREDLTRAHVPRVVRGGSWLSAPEQTQSAMRQGEDPMMGDQGIGFRLVYDPAIRQDW